MTFERSDGFQVIATGPGFRDRGDNDNMLRVNVDRSFDFKGSRWGYRAYHLGAPNSLHTAISKYDEQGGKQYDYWMDWHNMVDNPQTVRSLVYLATQNNVSPEVRLARMQGLAEALQAYDSLMVPYDPSLSKAELERLLNSGHLPRPKIASLGWSDSDGGLGLDILCEELGLLINSDDALVAPQWDHLVELARSGELTEKWRSLTATREGRRAMFNRSEADPNAPKPFGKDAFCLAVCGRTTSELHDLVNRGFIDPFDKKFASGRDMPRTGAEMIEDSWRLFMTTRFEIPLARVPTEKMYEAFLKFRRDEEYFHTRSNPFYQPEERYWGPVYQRIEEAHASGDEGALKIAIQVLVDKILHI